MRNILRKLHTWEKIGKETNEKEDMQAFDGSLTTKGNRKSTPLEQVRQF